MAKMPKIYEVQDAAGKLSSSQLDRMTSGRGISGASPTQIKNIMRAAALKGGKSGGGRQRRDRKGRFA